jgi:hypothetical protein
LNEHTASVFKVKEYGKQATSKKQATSRAFTLFVANSICDFDMRLRDQKVPNSVEHEFQLSNN